MNPGPVYTLMAVFTLGNKIYDTQRCRDDDEYSLFFSWKWVGWNFSAKTRQLCLWKLKYQKRV